jgi:hypothetical protein
VSKPSHRTGQSNGNAIVYWIALVLRINKCESVMPAMFGWLVGWLVGCTIHEIPPIGVDPNVAVMVGANATVELHQNEP